MTVFESLSASELRSWPCFIELKLYVIVLEQQEKHQEAYDFLRTEWGDKFKLAAEGDKLRLKFAVRLELWNDVFELCKKLVLSEYVWKMMNSLLIDPCVVQMTGIVRKY